VVRWMSRKSRNATSARRTRRREAGNWRTALGESCVREWRMSRSVFCLVLVALVTVAVAPARFVRTEERSLRLGGTPLQMLAGRSSLWVLTCDRRCSGEARRSTGRIVRIDPQSGRVVASASLQRPGALAVGTSGVFATDFWRDTHCETTSWPDQRHRGGVSHFRQNATLARVTIEYARPRE
jgi:hypothetical protein